MIQKKAVCAALGHDTVVGATSRRWGPGHGARDTARKDARAALRNGSLEL